MTGTIKLYPTRIPVVDANYTIGVATATLLEMEGKLLRTIADLSVLQSQIAVSIQSYPEDRAFAGHREQADLEYKIAAMVAVANTLQKNRP